MKRAHPGATLMAALLLTFSYPFESARAQAYPNKPVRLLVTAAPGGTPDLLARIVAAGLSDVFSQQVVVENRASASGVVAAQITAKSEPDGHTLLFGVTQHTVVLDPKLPYHPVNDFTPITQLTRSGFMLLVAPSAPVRSLKEFIDWTKGYNGSLNFASPGLGTGGHLAGELLNRMAGVQGQHIPYKGGGPALAGMLGGQVLYMFQSMQTAAQLARSGRVRGLAVTTLERVGALPNLPSMSEALPGFEVIGWYGILGPANMPSPVVSRLHGELVKIIKGDQKLRERIIADGSEPVGSTPQEFRKFLLAEMVKAARLVKESGAKQY